MDIQEKTSYNHTLRWSADFNDTMVKFRILSFKDKRILDSIPLNKIKVKLKNGLVSESLRLLIEDYVKLNWDAYQKTLKKGVEKSS